MEAEENQTRSGEANDHAQTIGTNSMPGTTENSSVNRSRPARSVNFTPAFPSYTSGHATFGAALFKTLERFYGRDDITFTFLSDEFNGITRGTDGQVRPIVARSYTSFSQAALENGQSRIYLGIHWGFDRDQGINSGSAIANYVFDNFLQSAP